MSINSRFECTKTTAGARSAFAACVVMITLASCGSGSKDAAATELRPEVTAAAGATVAPSVSEAPSAPSAATTLAGPVANSTAGSVETSASDMRTAVVAHVVGGALGAGLDMDEACVAAIAAKLSEGDLATLFASLSTADDAEPTLTAEGEALASALDTCVTNIGVLTTGLPGDVASADEDVCSRVDVAVLSQLHTGLGAGSNARVIGPWGPGVACRFDGDAGSRVTVTVTRNADVNGWSDEATDGDGIGDGELRRGIGQLAVVGVGYAGAVVGDQTLIEVTAFPALDLAADSLAQVLGDVVDGYPY